LAKETSRTLEKTHVDVKGKSGNAREIQEKKHRMMNALEVCLRAGMLACPHDATFPVRYVMVRNSFLVSGEWCHEHIRFRRACSAPCSGQHFIEVNQKDVKRALRAQELHFSPIEALLGNHVRQWSIWHLSVCGRLQDTPFPHMVFSYIGFHSVVKLHTFSKDDGLVIDEVMHTRESTFRTVTMLETAWDYLPCACHVNPPDHGPLSIDDVPFKYFVNPRRLMDLEDTGPGPMLVALARQSNGMLKMYYMYGCGGSCAEHRWVLTCDGICGNSKKDLGSCKRRFFQYAGAEVQVLIPSGSTCCPDWREYAVQDPRTLDATRVQLHGLTQAEPEGPCMQRGLSLTNIPPRQMSATLDAAADDATLP